MSSEPPPPHPWFRSTTGTVVMSHSGRVRRKAQPGSLAAIKGAYAAGFRWFQIDVVPIKGDLVSLHALFGRRFGFRRRTLEQVRHKLGYDVPTLSQVLDDPELLDARWNIEVKSRTALPALLAILKRSNAISRVMVSAPMHRSVGREVKETFGSLVAVTAPFHHGGTLGRRFLTPKVEYDGLQVYRAFASSTRRRHGRRRTQVQSWKITDLEMLDACLDARCHPIVTRSDDQVREHLTKDGRWPTVPPEWTRVTEDVEMLTVPPRHHVATDAPIDVLLLGGGGWRAAYGSIGTVTYLQSRGLWSGVQHVVGISGGSFVAGVLGTHGADDNPAPRLAELGRRIMLLRRKLYASVGLAVVAPIIATVVVAWRAPGWWLIAAPTLALYAFRWTISRCWRWMLRSLYSSAESMTTGSRRYVVCATGRSSARPHFFVAGGIGGTNATVASTGVSEPWGRIVPDGWDWTDAVVSSTALPWVSGYRTTADPTLGAAGRPERLIDGGVVGILGRQWFDQSLLGTKPNDSLRSLAIDTGRIHRPSSRLVERATEVFTAALLSRWVQIALDAAFRKEIERASRAEEEPDARMHLVRVAETDTFDHHDIRALRDEALRRLEHGRCIVRRFGLMGLTRRNCLLAVVVSVAACMFDLEHDPDEADVRRRLADVGRLLEVGDELATIWDAL